MLISLLSGIRLRTVSSSIIPLLLFIILKSIINNIYSNLFSDLSCPDLQKSLTNNVLTPITLIGYHINDTVKFLCDLGYDLLGPDILKCIINDSHTGGKWTNNQPICQCK